MSRAFKEAREKDGSNYQQNRILNYLIKYKDKYNITDKDIGSLMFEFVIAGMGTVKIKIIYLSRIFLLKDEKFSFLTRRVSI